MITLLTDFGLDNHFVGTLKGVIWGINAEVKIVDICHGVKPHDINEASYFLDCSYRFFPKGTIHVIVVDPGVGSSRRSILLYNKEHYFIAPDNGVLWPILKEFNNDFEVISINNQKYFLDKISQTFHGRDIFAPAAAYLSLGIDHHEFGDKINDYCFPEIKNVTISKDGKITGSVIYIDHFGNIITNIDKKIFSRALDSYKGQTYQIIIKNWSICQVKDYYAQGHPGEIMVLFGSNDLLEIAVNCEKASNIIGAEIGDKIEIFFKEV